MQTEPAPALLVSGASVQGRVVGVTTLGQDWLLCLYARTLSLRGWESGWEVHICIKGSLWEMISGFSCVHIHKP